jgi:hypothetical protein
VQIGAARLKAEGMDIVQITDTASYGTPKAQEENLVQCAGEEGIVQIRRKSLGEPYELTLLPRAPDLYIPRKTCRTTFSMDLLLALMERSDFAWLCDTVARHETSTSETAIFGAPTLRLLDT